MNEGRGERRAERQPAGAATAAFVEVLESVVEAANGREALWYPVGIVLAVLAASGALLLCCSGRWIG